MDFNLVIEGGQLFKTSEKGKSLLVNTDLRILAIDEHKEYLLLEVAGKGRALVKSELMTSQAKLEAHISPYVFLGTARDLRFMTAALVDRMKAEKCTKTLVDLTGIVGRHKDSQVDFWILADCIAWVENKTVRVMPHNGVAVYETETHLYYINILDIDEELKLGRVKVLERGKQELEEGERVLYSLLTEWKKQYGLEVLSMAVLGYFLACMYMPEVIECRERSFFPLFALSGSTKSGKTSLLSNYYKFWGLNIVGNDYTQVSSFVETKQLCQASCFPIWRDEMRMLGHALSKETILRSLYTRAAINKGTKDQGLKGYLPKGTLLLSGEDVPIDPAVRRRIVLFELQDSWKLPEWEFEEISYQLDLVGPKLFREALIANFNKTVFRKIMKMPFESMNGAEEQVLYAALGAVYGEPVGVAALKTAASFWEHEKNSMGFTVVGRVTFAEQFFQEFHSLAQTRGWYKLNSFLSIEEYFAAYLIKIEENYIKWNLKPLVDTVYQFGFSKKTSIGSTMACSLLASTLGGKTQKIKFGDSFVTGLLTPVDAMDNLTFPETAKMVLQTIQLANKKLESYRKPWEQKAISSPFTTDDL